MAYLFLIFMKQHLSNKAGLKPCSGIGLNEGVLTSGTIWRLNGVGFGAKPAAYLAGT